MKILVITTSDRAYNNIYEDKSGKAIVEILSKYYETATLKKIIVADEYDIILKTLNDNKSLFDIIITTGGTGLSKRDVTTDATAIFCKKEVPGISEYIRMESLKETKFAVLSRAFSGINDNTFVVNFPGSEKGATFCANLIAPLLEHIIKMMKGEGH